MNVIELAIYPVKSLGGLSLPATHIDRFGPQWDRRWMVVDTQGKFITQRQFPQMALIHGQRNGDQVGLSMAGKSTLRFSAADFNGEIITVTIWRDQCLATLGSHEMHQWLSDALGVQCQLVFMHEQSIRTVDPTYAKQQETVGFADGFPLLLTNSASLKALNDKMTISIGMNRFRPNIVIDGAEAWQEDHWKRIQIGGMSFKVVKPCSRCVIPTIDPITATKQPEVFKTLQRYRKMNGEVYFGQNLLPCGIGDIHVGDAVTVLD